MMNVRNGGLAGEASCLRSAWASFLNTFPADYNLFAVTLAFNNRIQGTVFPAKQQGSETGAGVACRANNSTYRLGGYRHVPVCEITRNVNHAWLKTNKRLWGDRYVRSRRPVSVYRGFIEKRTENVHVHLAWALPPVAPHRDFGDALKTVWLGLVPSGSTHIEPLSAPLGWGDYIVKKVFKRDWSDRSGRIPQPNDEAENFLSSLPHT